jgi:hypothetical protein
MLAALSLESDARLSIQFTTAEVIDKLDLHSSTERPLRA